MVVVSEQGSLSEVLCVCQGPHSAHILLSQFDTQGRVLEGVGDGDVVSETRRPIHTLTQLQTEKGDLLDGHVVMLHLMVEVQSLLKHPKLSSKLTQFLKLLQLLQFLSSLIVFFTIFL